MSSVPDNACIRYFTDDWESFLRSMRMEQVEEDYNEDDNGSEHDLINGCVGGDLSFNFQIKK
jgi:hypothetical protein